MEDKRAKVDDLAQKGAIPWYYHSFFQYALGTLIVLTCILIFYQVAVILKPFVDFISILFAPIVISILFYYLLRPIVTFFERFKIPRVVTIACIYLLLALGFIVFVAYLGPIVTKQVTELASTSVSTFEKVKESSRFFIFRFFNIDLDYEIEQRLFSIVQNVTAAIGQNLVDILAFLTRLAAILAVIPFIVFYLLKDDRSFSLNFLHNVPEDFVNEIRKILRNIDTTLSNYITGLALISITVGSLLFIGYIIIGLNYALVLAMMALVFMSIPYLGPFLSIAPALLVGLSESPLMVLKVAIVFVIVDQLDANFISPQIIGQRLNIHPLTVILLLLAAGSLYGLVGLILATPIYALTKVLIENGYKIYQLNHQRGGKKS